VIGWDVTTDVDVHMDLSLDGRHYCLIMVANWGQIKSVYLLLWYLPSHHRHDVHKRSEALDDVELAVAATFPSCEAGRELIRQLVRLPVHRTRSFRLLSTMIRDLHHHCQHHLAVRS